MRNATFCGYMKKDSFGCLATSQDPAGLQGCVEPCDGKVGLGFVYGFIVSFSTSHCGLYIYL